LRIFTQSILMISLTFNMLSASADAPDDFVRQAIILLLRCRMFRDTEEVANLSVTDGVFSMEQALGMT